MAISLVSVAYSAYAMVALATKSWLLIPNSLVIFGMCIFFALASQWIKNKWLKLAAALLSAFAAMVI